MADQKQHFCAVGIHLDVANRLWRGAMDKSVFQTAINHPHWLVLRAIIELGDGCTLTQVSTFLHSEISTCSRAITFLEKNKLITKQAVGDDMRAKSLFATQTGRTVHHEMDLSAEKVRKKLLVDITPEQLETFLYVLDQIKDKASQIIEQPLFISSNEPLPDNNKKEDHENKKSPGVPR
jgi:Transcriptional regulators